MTDVIYEQPVGDCSGMLTTSVHCGCGLIEMSMGDRTVATLSCRQAESLAELLLAAADAAREDGR
jgi:hypothetical protein